MDQNESTISLTTSTNSRPPISPSPVREAAVVAAPATVEEGINGTERKRRWPVIYGRDASGKFTTKSGAPSKKKSVKKRRGRKITTREYEARPVDMSMALGGRDFTPHIFTVNREEDIIERIMSFTENGSRGISILSANGTVTDVKIQLLSSPRRVVTCKDTYEILSLNSSMTISETGGVGIKTGGWQITIGGVNGGGIIGGVLAGRLIAASQVQVVIGSFCPPLVTNPSRKRKHNKSKAVVVAPTVQNSLASSSRGQVQQPDMMGPSQSQKRKDKSKAVVVAPKIGNSWPSSSTGQVQRQPDMMGSSQSQKRKEKSKAVVIAPKIGNSWPCSSTGQVQQPDMISPSQSQKSNAESEAVIVPPTIPKSLSFLFRRQVQQPDMLGPSNSQKRNDEAQAEVVPPMIPSAMASSSIGQAEQPEMIEPGTILTLGWYGSEPELKK